MSMTSTSELFGGFITDHLNGIVRVPEAFASMLNQSALRLMDSQMIIEDNFAERRELREPSVKQPLEEFEQQFVIDQLIDKVKEEGLAPHFHELIGLFGSIMLSLSGTQEQIDNVQKWVDQGLFGHFLMTDAGGPTLAHWQTSMEPNEQGFTLNVNKMWGIEAQDPGFLMIVTRQQGKPFPMTLLIDPERSAQLTPSAIGKPFLDGKLQLGNIKGTINAYQSDMLAKGGLGAVNRFLTLCRPRLVKSLMHFLVYLEQQGTVQFEHQYREARDYLIETCSALIAHREFSMHSVDRVLAIKFASNELLASLVANGYVSDIDVQRDLLAFTKMEGSSYRCFFEIYSKQKGSRR
ncbi:hypothetical protein [Pleionea sp. CnH1-48]|uniref:hypothetical protein n=1 Tax=Pleionea sp. CnH1-48 TaxID=2954494 RepID=UPI002096A0F0|nr:hypothetical protein [Pleionea sp. CnH1-48]MCO7225539.1 hypothetical protein [Pleionea sp. CnH1-48]